MDDEMCEMDLRLVIIMIIVGGFFFWTFIL